MLAIFLVEARVQRTPIRRASGITTDRRVKPGSSRTARQSSSTPTSSTPTAYRSRPRAPIPTPSATAVSSATTASPRLASLTAGQDGTTHSKAAGSAAIPLGDTPSPLCIRKQPKGFESKRRIPIPQKDHTLALGQAPTLPCFHSVLEASRSTMGRPSM
jgi:hypothetical protein